MINLLIILLGNPDFFISSFKLPLVFSGSEICLAGFFIYSLKFFLSSVLSSSVKSLICWAYFFKIKDASNSRYLICTSGLFMFFWPIIPTMDFFNQWVNILHFLTFGVFLFYLFDRKIDN